MNKAEAMQARVDYAIAEVMKDPETAKSSASLQQLRKDAMEIWHPALEGKDANYTSQFGEDGLIAAALELVGVEHKWCFEVGAADGLFFSNTKVLRDAGWYAVLVESNPDQFEKLKRWKSGKVQTVEATIGPAAIQIEVDCVLGSCGAPVDMELVVIDIDGQDYYAWQAMTAYRPRLVLIEFSPYGSDLFLPLPNAEGQAGLQPVLALGREKEYVALAKTYCNVLFAAKEYLE